MKIQTITRLTLLAFIAMGVAACEKKTAEQKGADMANEKIGMAKGIGDALTAKGEEASEAVVGGVGKVFKGVEKGVEKSGRSIVTDDSLKLAGLQVTKVIDASHAVEEAPATEATPAKGKGKAKDAEAAESAVAKTIHGIDAYVISDADVDGKLRVLVYDVMDQEIGRASVPLKRAADEAKYVTIALDRQVKLSEISKVSFQFKPNAPAIAAK